MAPHIRKPSMSERFFSRRKGASKPPLLLKFRSSTGFIVSVCCIAIFTDIFLYSIVIPIIPFVLTTRAGVPPGDVQYWTSALIACYSGALLVACPICGWLADRSSSRRRPLILGLLALGGSTALLCVGSSIGVLILGRLLEGLSGAVIWTSGPALLVDTVGQREIGKIMGYCSLAISAAILLGPLLGGVVFAQSGYYEVFAMAFGLIFLDIVLRLVLVEKKVAAKWSSASKERECRYWICNYATNGPPSIAPSPQMKSISVFGSLITRDDYESETPMISHQDVPTARTPRSRFFHNLPHVVTLLRSRRLLAALWGSLVQSAVVAAFDSVLPLFVHHTFGWGSTGAGLIFLAIVIPCFAAPLVGWMTDRHGPRWLVAIGFTMSLPVLVLLRLITHDSVAQIILLCVLLALLGISMTLVMVPLMAEITYVVEAKEKENPGRFKKGGAYAQAYGLYFCWFAGGALIGPIWAGFMEQRAGWKTMTWSLGLLGGLTAIPSLIFTGGLITRRKAPRQESRGDEDRVIERQRQSPQWLRRLEPLQLHRRPSSSSPTRRRPLCASGSSHPGGGIVHIITMPSITRQQIDSFVRDLGLENHEIQVKAICG